MRHLGTSRARRRGATALAVSFIALSSRIAHADPTSTEPPSAEIDAPIDDAELQLEAWTAEDDAMLERLHAAETSPPPPRPIAPEPVPEFMSPVGVDDPFPTRAPVVRARQPAILLGLGLGVAIASTITARLTLLPDCTDERDAMTCTVPTSGDIGIRAGRLAATVAFSIGGAAFGGLGGRELGLYLQRGSGDTLERRRRIAVGVGTTNVVLGVVGIIAGATVLGVGAQRSLALASTFDQTTDMTDPAVVSRIGDTVDNVRVARVGLMVLSVAPAFLASGIGLLVHRPRAPRVNVSPLLSRTMFGLGASMRF